MNVSLWTWPSVTAVSHRFKSMSLPHAQVRATYKRFICIGTFPLHNFLVNGAASFRFGMKFHIATRIQLHIMQKHTKWARCRIKCAKVRRNNYKQLQFVVGSCKLPRLLAPHSVHIVKRLVWSSRDNTCEFSMIRNKELKTKIVMNVELQDKVH